MNVKISMVVMVRDTSLDAVERDRILSPGKQKNNNSSWEGERTGETQGYSLGPEGYSGTTVHHYVQAMPEKEDSSYWTAGSQMMSLTVKGSEEGEVSLAMESSSHVSGEKQVQEQQVQEQLSKQEREAKEVEDVIRRHTIRKFQEEMAGGTKKNTPTGVVMKKKGDGSSVFVTPKKGRRTKKGKTKRKGFGIFGNLFSSQQASPVEEEKMERLRPPILVVENLLEDEAKVEERRGDGNGCTSPLMVTSPGLSCGGLLDEAFASAMRGAEDGFHDEVPAESGVEDEDLYMALSPSSLLASPRVVRKFSNARRPLHAAQKQNSGSHTTIKQSDKNQEDNPGTDCEGAYVHVRAYEPEDSCDEKENVVKKHEGEPMVPLHVHDQEMKKLRSMIKDIEEQHAARMQELENTHKMTAGEYMTVAAHNVAMEKIQAQNTAFIKQLEFEHTSKIKELEKLVESYSARHAATEDMKQKCMVLEEEKKSLALQLQDAIKERNDTQHGEVELLKTRCEALERSNQGQEKELKDLRSRHAEMEHASAEALQRCMESNEAKECLQKQVEDVQKQKSLIEETSLALASQIASLQSRLHAAEKLVQDAQQQLRIQDATMQTRVSTMESLNSDIQRLTRENTRLVGDKANIEEHMRRLTSILHTVMTRNAGAPNADLTLQIPPSIENISDVAIRDMVTNKSEGTLVTQTEIPLMPRQGRDPQQGGRMTEEKFTKPLSTDITPGEVKVSKQTRMEELDKQLLQLNLEREKIDLELSQMPQNSRGKTVAQRNRKKQLEYKLDELVKDIGKIKRELRALQR